MIADHENAGSLALLCNFPLHTLWSFDVAIEKCLFKVVIIELNGSTMFKGPWLPWQAVKNHKRVPYSYTQLSHKVHKAYIPHEHRFPR